MPGQAVNDCHPTTHERQAGGSCLIGNQAIPVQLHLPFSKLSKAGSHPAELRKKAKFQARNAEHMCGCLFFKKGSKWNILVYRDDHKLLNYLRASERVLMGMSDKQGGWFSLSLDGSISASLSLKSLL